MTNMRRVSIPKWKTPAKAEELILRISVSWNEGQFLT